MAKAQRFEVEVGGKQLVVQAVVHAPSREEGQTFWDTTISSVKGADGVELSDAEFDPIATQIESAVVDAFCARRHEARMAADPAPVSAAVFAYFGG